MKMRTPFSKYYPKIFELSDLETRKEVLMFWDMFARGLEDSQSKITDFVKYICDSDANEDHFHLKKTLYGWKNNRWDINTNEFLRVYIEYCKVRGTKKGLLILLNSFLPGVSVEIHENTFPGDAFILGQTRLGLQHRLVDENVENDSLLLKFDVLKNTIATDVLEQVVQIIKKELPLGVHLYIQFKDSFNKSQSTKDYYSYGEAL